MICIETKRLCTLFTLSVADCKVLHGYHYDHATLSGNH
nr:MAG TPA: hypothetical protein [Caudoviricetes sp.]